jgi:molybdopterin-containing oxidoreductase family membrane subunit
MLKVDPVDKEKLIDPLYTTSKKFWVLLAVLIAIMAWGMIMYFQQLRLGLGVTGMNRPVFWGMYMVNFIFFIGISHAGTLISAILRVTGAEWRRSITRIAEAITVVALLVGSMQIILDMGRPDRLLYVFSYGRIQSPLLWDAISVTAYFLGSLTYFYLPLIPDTALLRDNFPEDGARWRLRLYTFLALGWRGNKTQWLRFEKAIGFMSIIIIPIDISVHTIISWILATTVQPGWQSTIFGPYFVVGAIFSGIAALFIAMTVIRRVRGLEDYLTVRQYRNLGLLFLVMNAIWMYFTYAEFLTLAAGQQVNEFPVFASKLWGEFAPGFWLMVALMTFAFWVMVVPLLMPEKARQMRVFQPRVAVGNLVLAVFTAVLFFNADSTPMAISVDSSGLRFFFWFLLATTLLIAGLGLASWLKPRPVGATTLAALAVLIGMWLERWNIIVPTLVRPYLVSYGNYQPTLMEISLLAASVALFIFLCTIIFKLVPVVSIWEIAEGRVIDEAKAVIPMPEPSAAPRRSRLRNWGTTSD